MLDVVDAEDLVDGVALFAAVGLGLPLVTRAIAGRLVHAIEHVLPVLLVVAGKFVGRQGDTVHRDQPLVGVAGLRRRVDLVRLDGAARHLPQLADLDLVAAFQEGVVRLQRAIGAKARLDLSLERIEIGQRAFGHRGRGLLSRVDWRRRACHDGTAEQNRSQHPEMNTLH